MTTVSPNDISDPLIDQLVGPNGPVRLTDIGADRGFTGRTLKVEWSANGVDRCAVVKIPDVSENVERCAREIRFFETLAPALGDRVPGFLCARESDAPPAVSLALEWIDGDDGDAECGCAPDDVVPILEVLAELHAFGMREPGARAHPWLPRWGQGTVGDARPHRRRAERFVKRAALMRKNYGDHIGPIIDQFMRAQPEGLETLLAEASEYVPTLIHADVHLDNVLVRARAGGARTPVLLDWQSVSVGPAAYDVVRLLSGALRGAAHQSATADLVDAYIDCRRAAGSPIDDVDSFKEELRRHARLVMVGFVSGCASLTAANTPMRHVRMIQADLSDSGLPGACAVIESLG